MNMTKRQKEILLKDLLGRVLYGVKVDYHDNICTLGYSLYLNNSDAAFENHPMAFFLENIESIKPYLRPMSSMTEDELNEYENFITNEKDDQIRFCNELVFYHIHHFDYRGLIPMGLALPALENMYK